MHQNQWCTMKWRRFTQTTPQCTITPTLWRTSTRGRTIPRRRRATSTTTSTDLTRSSKSIRSKTSESTTSCLQFPPLLLCYRCFLSQVDHADGRSQHVEYTSGDVKGYRANVEYRLVFRICAVLVGIQFQPRKPYFLNPESLTF